MLGCLALLALPAGAAGNPLKKITRLRGVELTEYWPAPESWFKGALVTTPGLPGKHRIDWLYSATGLSMQGDGIGLDGRPYHIDNLGDGGWINAQMQSTDASDGFSGGPPIWRSGGYWLNARRRLTYPLAAGGWSNGPGHKYVKPPAGISFAAGPSRPLTFYRSVAVDPSLIPLGSVIYISKYRNTSGHGWFVAQDTGGAILGRHLDVYRSPPASPNDSGNEYLDQTVVVYPPGTHPPAGVPALATSNPGTSTTRAAAGAAPKLAPVKQIGGGASPGI